MNAERKRLVRAHRNEEVARLVGFAGSIQLLRDWVRDLGGVFETHSGSSP